MQDFENNEVNNLIFVCNLIEYVAYKTNNTNVDIVNKMGYNGVANYYYLARQYSQMPVMKLCSMIIAKHRITRGKGITDINTQGVLYHRNMLKLVNIIERHINEDIIEGIIKFYNTTHFEDDGVYDGNEYY